MSEKSRVEKYVEAYREFASAAGELERLINRAKSALEKLSKPIQLSILGTEEVSERILFGKGSEIDWPDIGQLTDAVKKWYNCADRLKLLWMQLEKANETDGLAKLPDSLST